MLIHLPDIVDSASLQRLVLGADAVFITAGIAGFGATVAASLSLSQWVTWGGAGFLFVYGCGSLRSAIKGESLNTNHRAVRSLSAAILTTLAVTLMNPHFYLDTLLCVNAAASIRKPVF